MLDQLVTLDPIPLNLTSIPLSFAQPLSDTTSIKDKFLAAGGGRIDRAEVRKRAAESMARKLPHHLQCINDSHEWAIIGFGPSLKDSLPEIRRLKRNGAKIVTVNKAHDFLLDHGIPPWAHVLLDPKDWVAKYVQKPRRDVRYFVASQCHDDTFEALKDFPVFLWHAGQDFPEGPEPAAVLREKWPTQPWFIVPGPTTVGLRTIFLGSQLGASHFHLFGMDSSRTPNGPMHAGPKPEAPDAQPGTLKIKHRGMKYSFDTNSHMARQQFDFDKLIEEIPKNIKGGLLPKGFDVTVYGSGLLPFFAAMIGLHADPACNADPARVGGYVTSETTAMVA